MANTTSVRVQMKNILDSYQEEVQKAMDASLKEVPKQAAQKLKNTSPRKTGKYSRGWSVKNEKSRAIVYNRTNWQLTHLLENGHVIRNKKGTYGRAPAHPHIKPVQEWASEAIVQDIERRLN